MQKRDKHLPLTETTFYILLALRKPAHGYGVMQTVEALSDGAVRIAAGTMYGAIENLLKQGMIKSLPSGNSRRKVYQITEYGADLLRMDMERLAAMLAAAKAYGGQL